MRMMQLCRRGSLIVAGTGVGLASCHSASNYSKTPAAETGRREGHLLFAIPKKGRLHEQIITMLKGSGFDYSRPDRVDIAHCKDLPVSLVFLPAADIATYVAEGDVDLGITGEDIVAEGGSNVSMLLELGFGKCRLSVQAPVGSGADSAALAGKRIVTSFPDLTRKHFSRYETDTPTRVKTISGSVEAACGLGLADGIVDLVETGTTMRAAGLEEVSVIMKTQACLVSNPHTAYPELVELIRKRLAGYLTASRYVMVTYNVHRTALGAATRVTPGKRSPSVMNLDDSNWCSVSALVEKQRAASVMDELESIGATDILTTALLSSRMGE